MSKLSDALVQRALRLQDHTSLESLAIQIERWYREVLQISDRCKGYVIEDGFVPPWLLALEQLPRGWYAVGSGHFSYVIAHDSQPEYVFKLCVRPDDAYINYAAWCVAKYNSGEHVGLSIPYIPFVHMTSDHVRVIPVMRLIEVLEQDDSYDEFRESVLAVLEYMYGLLEPSNSYDYIVPEKMRRTLHAIAESFTGLRSVDIHNGNVMLGKDGEMVLTDPFAFVSDVGTWRKRGTGRKYK